MSAASIPAMATSYGPVPTNHNTEFPTEYRDNEHGTPEATRLNDDLPVGAAQPRFMGHAMDPEMRNSYASSSQRTFVGDEYYAGGAGGKGFYGVNYADQSQGDFSNPNLGDSPYMGAKEEPRDSPYLAPARARSRRRKMIIGGIVGLAVVIAVAVGVYFAVGKKKDGSDGKTTGASGTGKGDNGTNPPTKGNTVLVSGGDGTEVPMSDGTKMKYKNSFGGRWYWDPADPLNNGAKPNSWTPALNETFKFGEDLIQGVNLGGWLVTEPQISVPALYEKYQTGTNPAIDEWSLCENMAQDTAGGGLGQLEEHYKTFITEKDFAEIAAAGLNFVRIPIGYWAIETRENEPFLPRTSWNYFLKAIEWARKYGLRINLDLHSLPGSQNVWNHSGHIGHFSNLIGPMGYANAQRSLDYIRIFVEFISQPQYKDVVPFFGVTNEPFGPNIGEENIKRYYVQAYKTIREITGVGEGNGPYIVIHDAFLGLGEYKGFLPNADRVQLDIHQYIAFGGVDPTPYSGRKGQPCRAWANGQNQSMTDFGPTHVGEWSLAINDCGLWVNGVGQAENFGEAECVPYRDWTTWTPAYKKDVMNFMLESMSAFQNYFFWTWKIGDSTVSGKVESPAWSYQLGLKEGYAPTDPRMAFGKCDSVNPYVGPPEPWQTGGAGAGQIPAAATAQFPWPPASLSFGGDVATLPTYVANGPLITLPGPTFTSPAKVDTGSGWFNSKDQAPMHMPDPACGYLDPWMGTTAEVPACATQGLRRRDAHPALATPAPTAMA